MSLKARIYVGLIIVTGIGALLSYGRMLQSEDWARFVVYLIITILASFLKVRLPGVTGTMSVYFLFLLISITEMTLPEVLIISLGATLAQCYWGAKRRPKLVQTLFNIGSTSLAVVATGLTYQMEALAHQSAGNWLQLGAAAVVFFVTNTGPVAIVIALTEGKSPRKIWQECYFWCFPYYLVGASIAGSFGMVSRSVGWQAAPLILPVIYVIYRSYHLYLGRLEDEKNHAEQMASLHLRTIEALALAIDAKDHTTRDHLRRVQIYALELGKELGLTREQQDALQAAALLHDIGKLAVPEHIISKPGKLTPEEFEKMKIHPVVGAEILERVQFPYPVVPIVRAHHEKWDGTGYPDGLKGDQIPIGARILSVVDCMDALASDRQYRRALPPDEAMAAVEAESGKSFDPAVVAVLRRRFQELEDLSQRDARVTELRQLSRDVKTRPGIQPAAGFANEGSAAGEPGEGKREDFLLSIASARQEAQTLFELAQALGNSLSLSDTLSVVSARLQRLIPFDCMAVYVVRDEKLHPEFVSGEDSRLFSSLEIPLGEGLSGWVAENCKPIVNGNPSVEPAYLNNPALFSKLNSALAVPLKGGETVVGVVSLYRAQRDSFSRDEMRVLQAVSAKLSVSVENAMKYQQAENSATTDYLTTLPNARSLFVHLDSEVARCRRSGASLTVLVCDLDGFKSVNDRFGHLAGNRVLKLVALGLREKCREYDYVARMGGDEFVIVLPGVSPDVVRRRVEVFDQVAVRAGIEVCGEAVLGLSAGAATFPTSGINAEELLAEADREMYKFKQERKRLRALASGQPPAEEDRVSAR